MSPSPMESRRIVTRRRGNLTAGFCVTVMTLFCCGFFGGASALASYEQVGNFAGTPGMLELNGDNEAENATHWPEEVQLGGVNSMAVNYTGAGGVPAGTIYTFGGGSTGEELIARFNPDGSFSEAWSFDGNPPNRRCGPDGLPAQPTCASQPGEGGGRPRISIGVDQSTGYVYALTSINVGGTEKEEEEFYVKNPSVHVYSADGSKVISEFGVRAIRGQSITQSPERLHGQLGGSLAVDSTGDVFVYDSNFLPPNDERLMEFVPESPGDFEHYVYAGEGHDLTWPLGRPVSPVADAAGRIYVGGESDGNVAEFDPSGGSTEPVCEYSSPAMAMQAMTVDQLTGEVFFYNAHDHRVHQLHACDGEGQFVEAGETAPLSPLRELVGTLAFDPVRRFAPGRPPGVLYVGARSGAGGKTEGVFGTPEYKTESSLGYVFARPLELPPVVVGISVSHVASGSAVLNASVNPEGSSTRYAFQYVTQASYEANEAMEPFAGAVEVPLGGAVAGEGNGTVSVSEAVSGLSAATTYRYRIIVSSDCSVEEPEKVCEASSEAGSFRTFAVSESSALPDGRVYELVSPSQKYGGQVFPAEPDVGSCGNLCKPDSTGANGVFPRQVSVDGDAVAYEGSAFAVNSGPVVANEYISHRDPKSGWSTVDITPTLLSQGQGYQAFSNDLKMGVLDQDEAPLSGEAPGEYADLYSQPTGEPGVLTSLLRSEPPNRPAGEFKVRYAGASSDLSRVFFEADDALTEEDPGVAPAAQDGGPGKFNLYEWHEGQLALVNVLPGNTVTQPGARFGTFDAHAISNDGTRAFFSAETGQVYVRENGQDTSEIETEGVPDPGRFLVASSDGSKVLLANGHLHSLEGADSTIDLTEGKGGFQGVVGQSEDLTHVYFVDTKVLSGEEENEHCTIVAGKKSCEKAGEGDNNVYSWTQTGGTRFIGTLASGAEGGFMPPNDWTSIPSRRTAQASPDGRFLAFMSTVPLTGYDNTGPCESDKKGGAVSAPCPEVFLYDSTTDRLACASCNRSGVAPLGYSVLPRVGPPGGGENVPLPQYLSDQGRLFFDSEDSLVPADTNSGVEDVYEYEPESIGTCREASGCVFLISGGTSKFDSDFLGADASGSNVFFTTVDKLSPRDGDELVDLYDARVDGGGVTNEQASMEVECHGEACQPLGIPLMGTAGPMSFTFQGAGNVPPPPPPPPTPPAQKAVHRSVVKRCTVGKKRVKGKCVNKKPRKAHRANTRKAASVRRNRGGSR